MRFEGKHQFFKKMVKVYQLRVMYDCSLVIHTLANASYVIRSYQGITMKNLLVTIPQKYEIAWAAEMEGIEQKMATCLFPKPVGRCCAPDDCLAPQSPEHRAVRSAFRCCQDLDTLFPASKSVTLESFTRVNFLGRVFSVGAAMAFDVGSTVQYAYITCLHRFDACDSLWLAKVTPFKEVKRLFGIRYAIAPDQEQAPLPTEYVWLNWHATVPVNVVPTQINLDSKVWLIPIA